MPKPKKNAPQKCKECGDTCNRKGKFRVVIGFTHGMEEFQSRYIYTDEEAHKLWHKCKAEDLNVWVEPA